MTKYDDLVKRLRGPIQDAAHALINDFFGNKDTPKPEITIPAKESNTDLVLVNGIKEAADAIEALQAEVAEAHAAAIEAAAKALNDRGVAEQEDYGLGRETQNFYRARDIIRALHIDASRAYLAERDERIKREAREEALMEAIIKVSGCDRVSEVQPAIEAMIEKGGE